MSTESSPPVRHDNSCMLVIGGCRSGKSRFAQATAEALAVQQRIFVATCIAQDEEMQARVAAHRLQRNPGRWQTVEEPLALAAAIRSRAAPDCVILVDCLTLWVTNLLMAPENTDLHAAVDELIRALQGVRGPVILVSNEVGTGIVPENALARRFRDAAGMANQAVAAIADRVVWMVAGIPVTVKPAADDRPDPGIGK